MTLHQIKSALYALFLTNKFGFRLRKARDNNVKNQLRLEYSETLLSYLNINIKSQGVENIQQGAQYLIASNHRSIIDPLIIESAMKGKGIHSLWISKKELYNSFFFGMFTRNAGTILLDRESKQMSSFFKEIKEGVNRGDSISIFPEGTRNKTEDALSTFKEGSQIIAMKNRLMILPVFIKDNANSILMDSIKNNKKNLEITIIVGEPISYRDRSQTLEEAYRKQFNI